MGPGAGSDGRARLVQRLEPVIVQGTSSLNLPLKLSM